MLGASHSNNYTMWKFGTIATDGLKEIAEWGNTYKGEQEMKANVLDHFLRKEIIFLRSVVTSLLNEWLLK